MIDMVTNNACRGSVMPAVIRQLTDYNHCASEIRHIGVLHLQPMTV